MSREAMEKALDLACQAALSMDSSMSSKREARALLARAIEALRAALAEANPMQCERCGIKFADKQPGSTCPKCYRQVTKAEAPNPWKDAVHDALVINWAFTAEHEDNPRKAVADLIMAEVRIALDPLVSSEAQALIDRGKAESAGAEPVAWRVQRTDKAYELFFNKHMAERAAACYLKKPEVEPLYTHPPAREAELSDEDILGLWRECRDFQFPTRGDVLKFARAVLDAMQEKVEAALLVANGGEE